MGGTMTAADLPGVTMSNAVRLQVDWPAFGSNLANIFAGGLSTLLGSPEGAVSGLASVLALAGNVKVEDSAETKAWQIFWLSIAWAADDLRQKSPDDADRLSSLVVTSMREAANELNGESYQLDFRFLTRPTSQPVYQAIRDKLIRHTELFQPGAAINTESLRYRFDRSFNRAVFELWSKKSETFQALRLALEAPGSEASAFDVQWASYRQRLIYEFESRPVFGQESSNISLAQLYVPLRAYWTDKSQEPLDAPETAPVALANFLQLDESLDSWAVAGTPDAPIRLIGGGPGSGKSTTMKAFARRLAEMAEVRPLYIPLQHISMDASLRDAVNDYFTGKSNSAFTSPPLAREAVEDGAPLILLFDGLDEIARPGEAANDIAREFIAKIGQLQAALAGAKPIKILISGRMPSFQAACRFASLSRTSAVEVWGYGPWKNPAIGDEELVRKDQRPEWWEKYATATSQSLVTPRALIDDRLADITSEPLLCYLLVLSGFAVDDWESAAENRNLIYKRLIDEVWQRGWGAQGNVNNRQGAGKHLSKPDFNKLMETIALAAWLGGDARVASEEGFRSAIRFMQSQEAWESFNNDGGDDVANLAMNFYLKSKDESHRGFEFTHKSFGEYLAARAIISVAEDISSQIPRYTERVLPEWIGATGGGRLTPEILEFIRDEIRLKQRDRDIAGDLLQKMEYLAKLAIDEGFPMHTVGLTDWQKMSKHAVNSEVAVWAIMNACARALNAGSHTSRHVDVGSSAGTKMLRSLVQRLVLSPHGNPTFGQCLAYVKAPHSDLFGMNLSNFDFSGADLTGSNLNGTHLMNASLTDASIDGVMLQRANLDGASFHNAEFDRIDLTDARTPRSNPLEETSGEVVVSYRTLLELANRAPDPGRLRYRWRAHEESGFPVEQTWKEVSRIIENIPDDPNNELYKRKRRAPRGGRAVRDQAAEDSIDVSGPGQSGADLGTTVGAGQVGTAEDGNQS